MTDVTTERADAQLTALRPPAACGQEMEHIDWAGSSVYRVGQVLAGVRFDSAELHALVDEALAEHVMRDDEAPAYFSLRLGKRSRRRSVAPLHHVYVGGQPVFGSRDIKRIVGALVNLLGASLPREDNGLLHIQTVVVGSSSGAVLAPPDLLSMTKPVDKMLTSAGVALSDGAAVGLDVATGEVVIEPAPLDVAWSVLNGERLDPVGHSADEPRLAPGRYPVHRWLVSSGPDAVGPQRRAAAAQQVARHLATPLPSGAQRALNDAVEAARAVDISGVNWSTPDELVETVADAVGVGR